MKKLLFVALFTAGAVGDLGGAQAQVAGSTTVGVSITELSQVAMGWSAKKSILGKTIYNDAGERVGRVDDLIIAPDRTASYVIVGAGGFIGFDRHDVAIPVAQLQEQGGKLVMPGATKDAIKAMPAFSYASDTSRRDLFVVGAEQDIAKAKLKLSELEMKVAAASSDGKAKLDQQIVGLKKDLKAAEDDLSTLKHASVSHWRDFEGDASSALARLRKSLAG